MGENDETVDEEDEDLDTLEYGILTDLAVEHGLVCASRRKGRK